MGNTIAGNGKAKIMKLSGESFKLKTPITAMDVIKDYPGHALMESRSVQRFGIRAKPLELNEDLKPKKLYFLVELPKKTTMKMMMMQASCGAEDRLECMMKTRRSSSVTELRSLKKQKSLGGLQQVKVKLTRSQLEKITAESKDGEELALKVLDLCLIKATC